MSIGSISNLILNIPGKVTQKIASVVPSMTVANEKATHAIEYIGEHLSAPHNRLILGVSALMSQPFIDLSNKKVDEKTRKVSAARTVAKIIAGTLTGVAIRSGCIHGINAMSKLPEELADTTKFKALRMLFTPDVAKLGVLKNLKHYKNALGTIVSLVVMVFTNFLIDAPLTKFLTNLFIDKINKNDAKKNNSQDKQQSGDIFSKQGNVNKEVKHE